MQSDPEVVPQEIHPRSSYKSLSLSLNLPVYVRQYVQHGTAQYSMYFAATDSRPPFHRTREAPLSLSNGTEDPNDWMGGKGPQVGPRYLPPPRACWCQGRRGEAGQPRREV